ncbi:MAG: type IV secretion system protein [Candidatus Staskawiczbacteria bacterium]|nr:type IV secretion system protein [Candidatus Staskawiczbacteria bacterium]
MILQKIKKGIKKYFAPVFDPEKKESGFEPITILIILGGLVAAGVTAWYLKSEIGKTILYNSGSLVLGIARFLFNISSTIFETAGSSALLKRAITRDQTVIDGWTIVRDFANMFIVLGFVVIGIATILRIRTYEAQKTLLPLILVALLINFSLLICGIIIDGTNIAVNYFTTQQGGGAAGITQKFKPIAIDPGVDNALEGYYNKDDWQNYINLALSTSTYIGILAMIFFIYAVLLIFRYVALMCLVILSPLAFVCYVFPATKPIFNKWWTQFTQWAIIGIPTAFFIYLGGHLIQSMTSQPNGVLAFWIPAAFMLFAYTLIFQTSAIGASSAIGLATGAMGFAWGATKWTGGKALRAGGSAAANSKAGQWAGSKVGGALERIGLRSQGTTEGNKRKNLEESSKRLEKGFADNPEDNQKLAQISTQRAFSSQAMRDKAAATEILAKRNALNYIPEGQREAVAAHAISFGVPKETITKSHPHLATGVDDAQTRQRIINEKAAEYESRMSPEQAMKTAKAYKPTAPDIEKAKKTLTQEKIRERALSYQPISDTEVSQKLTSNKTASLKAAGKTDDEIAKEIKVYKPSTTDTLKARESLTQERITKSIRKLSTAKAIELPKEAIDAQTLSSFDDKQFAEIGKKAGPALVDHIKKFMLNPKSKKWADQSEEYKDYSRRAAKFAPGSPERKRMNDIQKYLANNPNFKS